MSSVQEVVMQHIQDDAVEATKRRNLNKSFPNHWLLVKLADVLREVDVRAKDLKIIESEQTPVLSLTKNDGLILQSERFNNRVATQDISNYKVVNKGQIVYNPFVLWEGAIYALEDREQGLVSPAYLVWEAVNANYNFLDFLLRTPQLLNEYLRVASGVVQRRRAVRKDIFLNISISLPPLSEQHAIVQVLQAVQEAIQIRKDELELEHEYKVNLMQYLFTHGIHNEPRNQTEVWQIPDSWRVVQLEEVCQFVQYGTSERCETGVKGIPVLRIPNVVNGRVDIKDLKYTNLPVKVVNSLKLEAGDLLFVRTNGSRENAGRCAVFNSELSEALFASYLIRVRLNPNTLIPKFVQSYTMTNKGKEFLSGRATATADGKFNINSQTIKSVLLPLPSLQEQIEIVTILDACDLKLSALEQELELLEELFKTFLEELMTGRLSTLPLLEKGETHD